MKNFKDLFTSATFLVKLIELILGVVEVVLWDNYFVNLYTHGQFVLMITATTAYLIIIGVIVLAFILDLNEQKTERIHLVIGAIINVISSILTIVGYCNHESFARSNNTLGVAISQLIKGIFMAIDCYLITM